MRKEAPPSHSGPELGPPPSPAGQGPCVLPPGRAYLREGAAAPCRLGAAAAVAVVVAAAVAAAGRGGPCPRRPASFPSSQSGLRRPVSPPGSWSGARAGGEGRISALPQQLAGRERGWLYFKLLSGSAGTWRPALPVDAVQSSCRPHGSRRRGHCPPETQQLLIYLQPAQGPAVIALSGTFRPCVPLPSPGSPLGGARCLGVLPAPSSWPFCLTVSSV